MKWSERSTSSLIYFQFYTIFDDEFFLEIIVASREPQRDCVFCDDVVVQHFDFHFVAVALPVCQIAWRQRHNIRPCEQFVQVCFVLFCFVCFCCAYYSLTAQSHSFFHIAAAPIMGWWGGRRTPREVLLVSIIVEITGVCEDECLLWLTFTLQVTRFIRVRRRCHSSLLGAFSRASV